MSELPISGAYRPTIMGTNGMVASGHYLATLAGERILARGGNAVDAGVAAGLCLSRAAHRHGQPGRAWPPSSSTWRTRTAC